MKKLFAVAVVAMLALLADRLFAAEYVVVSGDTWHSIGNLVGVDSRELAIFNNSKIEQKLIPGQRLLFVSRQDAWLAEMYCHDTAKSLPIGESGRYRDIANLIRAGQITYLPKNGYGIKASEVLNMARYQEGRSD